MKSIIAIIFILFVGLIGVKVSMVYIDKSTLVSSIATVDKTTRLSELPDLEIADIIISEFKKNGIEYIQPGDLYIGRDADNHRVDIGVKYQVKVTLIGNIGFNLEMSVDKKYLDD